MWMKVLQKTLSLVQPELGVLRLNAKIKAVATGTHKIRRIEYRMIRLWQSVERKHAKYRRQRCAQDGALERNWNECRPGVEGLAAYIEGVIHHRDPVFERVSAAHSQDGAHQRNQGH